MAQFNYNMPVRVIFGKGEFKNVGQHLKAYCEETKTSPKNILLVTGRSAMEKLGCTQCLLDQLKDYNVTVFNKVEPNPEDATVEEGKNLAQEKNIELLIALGGGSALDAAKAIAMLLTNPGKTINEHIESRGVDIKNKSLPVFAIPTTSGTGSEVTVASVISDCTTKKKMGIRSEYMYPVVAVNDPELTVKLPRRGTLHTGYDALSQAVESYLSISNKNPISGLLTMKAIKLVFDNLQKAADEPENEEARENMALASLYAGMAFTQTGTIAPHAFSCPLTTFHEIDHGYACILPLRGFLKAYERDGDDDVKRYIKEMAEVVGATDANSFVEKINELIKSCGEPTTLKELGIAREDKERIVENALSVLPPRDPIEVNADVMGFVFDEIYE